jgi:spermidine/putrescine transport system ATP-binding protein
VTDFAVKLHDVTKIFPAGRGVDEVTAVQRMNLGIPSGEFFTFLGPSGCGKTTTLRMIAGFEQPTGGEIYIYDKPIVDVPPNKRPSNMVFQNYALFPHLTVAQNVAFGLVVKRVPKEERDRRVTEALDLVQLPGMEDRKPDQLSGGQQQRVALARALINQPQVLLLDEPLGALDLKLRKAMQLELKHLQAQVGITFIYVTHDQEEALTMSDRIAIMHKGHILQVGSPVEIYERPTTRFAADFIGESNLLSGKIAVVSGERVEVNVGSARLTTLTDSLDLTPGQEITLAVRPEKVCVGQGGAVSSQSLDGTVKEIVYIGTDSRYLIDLPTGETIVARVQNIGGRASTSHEVGQSITVGWEPDDARILIS